MTFKPDYKGASYSAARPEYPPEVYDVIYRFHQGEWDHACDVGTGTGLGARELASKFRHVTGLDRLPDMIASATPKDNVTYKLASDVDLEKEMKCQSLDMVTVATAFHWFNQPAFMKQLKRVLKPHGTFAVWSYYFPLIKNHPQAVEYLESQWKGDGLIAAYNDRRTEDLFDMYRAIDFPFSTVQYYISPSQDTTHIGQQPNPIAMETTATLRQLGGYLKTSSAYANFKKDPASEKLQDPVDTIIHHLSQMLNKDIDDTIQLEWPLILVLCRD